MHFWYVFQKFRSCQKFWATFFHGKSVVYFFDQKMVWPTFWAIFSQPHLVTLPATQQFFLAFVVSIREPSC
jgi:hypothetical protein